MSDVTEPINVASSGSGTPSKACTSCGLQKPLDDFAKNVRASDGRFGYCGSCSKRRSIEWKERNARKKALWSEMRHLRSRTLRAIREKDHKQEVFELYKATHSTWRRWRECPTKAGKKTSAAPPFTDQQEWTIGVYCQGLLPETDVPVFVPEPEVPKGPDFTPPHPSESVIPEISPGFVELAVDPSLRFSAVETFTIAAISAGLAAIIVDALHRMF